MAQDLRDLISNETAEFAGILAICVKMKKTRSFFLKSTKVRLFVEVSFVHSPHSVAIEDNVTQFGNS
jgi:hypothetical protein